MPVKTFMIFTIIVFQLGSVGAAGTANSISNSGCNDFLKKLIPEKIDISKYAIRATVTSIRYPYFASMEVQREALERQYNDSDEYKSEYDDFSAFYEAMLPVLEEERIMLETSEPEKQTMQAIVSKEYVYAKYSASTGECVREIVQIRMDGQSDNQYIINHLDKTISFSASCNNNDCYSLLMAIAPQEGHRIMWTVELPAILRRENRKETVEDLYCSNDIFVLCGVERGMVVSSNNECIFTEKRLHDKTAASSEKKLKYDGYVRLLSYKSTVDGVSRLIEYRYADPESLYPSQRITYEKEDPYQENPHLEIVDIIEVAPVEKWDIGSILGALYKKYSSYEQTGASPMN
jgi:hypothetical protein